MVGYRIIRDEKLTGRSCCAKCKRQLAWWEILPVISWIFLRGRCHSCSTIISLLYPFIELLTAGLLTALWFAVSSTYFFAYAAFFSALIVSIRTDLETMLISQLVTVYLIPCAFIAACFGLLPVTPLESAVGAICGYGFLWLVGTIFKKITSKEGIGDGDFDLLAFIGSVCGLLGMWISVLLGSIIGSCVGIAYIVIMRPKEQPRIPFGPFLTAGAIIYVLYAPSINNALYLDILS